MEASVAEALKAILLGTMTGVAAWTSKKKVTAKVGRACDAMRMAVDGLTASGALTVHWNRLRVCGRLHR